MRVFVTGATGLLGGHLIHYLLRDHHEVSVLLRGEIPKRFEVLSSLKICRGDLCDPEKLIPFLSNSDVVIHAAADVSMNVELSEKQYHANVVGLKNLVEAAKKARVKRFIHISSAGVFERDERKKVVGIETQLPYIKTKMEAVLSEFDRISERGGVLGAMETMYQRGKIQEESLYYETLKHTGEYPIIGVNTFLSSKGSPTVIPQEVIRSTKEEKEFQIGTVQNLWKASGDKGQEMLKGIQQTAVQNGNIFNSLMETVKYCSLGQITQALFEVGGQYRRNM